MSTVNDKNSQMTNAPVTTGAGIAIAGLWLGASTVTITLLLIVFVFNKTEAAPDTVWFLLLLLASPMIAAYFVTKLILGKK